MLTLNIGSAIGDQDQALSRDQILDALLDAGIRPVAWRGFQSASEWSYCIRVLPQAGLDAKLHGVAVTLQQQAIAVCDPACQEGINVGPQADEWGAFDPGLFEFFNDADKATYYA